MFLTKHSRPSKNNCTKSVKRAQKVLRSRIIRLEYKNLTGSPYKTYCFNGTIQKRFLTASSLERKMDPSAK